ncbi:MAG: phytanoyl-CoA dioxygenase family protein [Pseudomonadota bacterium]
MRQLLYTLKHAVQKSPTLYWFLYNLATLNSDRLEQFLNCNKYPSPYGGMWTDRIDFEAELARRARLEGWNPEDLALLDQWRRDGYVILPQAIAPQMIDAYRTELEAITAGKDCSLLITGAKFAGQRQYCRDAVNPNDSIRIIDDYMFNEASRRLLFHPEIVGFLRKVFAAKPLLTQSLNFEYGSAQSYHQDTAFVRMTSPFKLAACWIALEDVQPGSGALKFVPGSHQWTDFLFSGAHTHYDEERDGIAELDRWQQWLENKISAHAIPAKHFIAKKGDVLIWHAGLAHGGGDIENTELTRRSLVAHYCSQGTRPLYHFYKPAFRKMYSHGQNQYTTSYYRW